MASFKLKLVAYFLLLSLLPLAAAFWGFSAVAKRSEVRRVDARLHAGLRASLAAYDEALSQATQHAQRLATDPGFQAALADHDRGALVRILRESPDLRVEAGKGFRIGIRHPLAAERQVLVIGPSGSLGRVIASVPLDSTLLRRLRARSGLQDDDHVVLLQAGRLVVGPGYLQGRVDAPAGRTTTISIADERYRVLVADVVEVERRVTLGVLSPQAAIDAASQSSQRRLLFGLVAALLLIALVAYLEGRSIVRTVSTLVDAANAIARGRLGERVPVRGRDELARLAIAFNDMAGQLEARLAELAEERGRLREAIARFGEALAATLDPDQLLRVIVETAVEATGAKGGLLLAEEGRVAEVGDLDAGPERLELPLNAGHVSYGTLILFGEEFDPEERMTAASLAAHAVVALDNERLHRIVERQALVDGLTGLGNRRQCEETLAAEISRAERFGDPVALVVADLDDFKVVNDRHGHAVGDAVLREFAAVLEQRVREVDLAARWGGEEFVLVLPGTDVDGGAQLAERIRAAVEERLVLSPEGEPIHITASFGVAAFPEGATPQELFAAADAALYEAKRSGKNRVETAVEPYGVRAAT